jgi:PEP-CTERM motif
MNGMLFMGSHMKCRASGLFIMLGLFACLLLGPSRAKADGITVLQAPIAFDGTTNLASLGADGTQVASGSSLSVSGIPGLTLTFSDATGLPLSRDDQGNTWSGNFAPGTPLLWTNGTWQGANGDIWQPNGPLTIGFSSPQRGLGFQIQADAFGPFTASLCAYDSGNLLLGCGNFTGDSTSAGDNSAIFVGLYDSQQNISSVVVNNGDGDFAISSPFVSDAPVPTPEPGTFTLLGIGLIGLLGQYAVGNRKVRMQVVS